MKYLPLSPKDKREMLDYIGVENIDQLFESIPASLRSQGPLDVPEAKSELEIQQSIGALADQNTRYKARFLGGGAYQHFIPVVVDTLSQRQEFLTSYTPYQPEISQGTLQYLFEFQTMMCTLTGQEVSNASMYDGATSTAEAVLMAARLKKKCNRILLSDALHPFYIDVTKTYLSNLDLKLETIPSKNRRVDMEALKSAMSDDVAAVVIGYPNFFGIVEPLAEVSQIAKEHDALTISVTQEALSLALLKTPGSQGADITVGEAQSFGVPTQLGGPYLGFFACADKLKRQMPGRICGLTQDRNGKRSFVLTLNAREQHIRRAKATSNICSNQGLCALRATIYLSCMGKRGLRELAEQNHAKSEYLKSELQKLEGVEVDSGPHFNEFAVKLTKPAKEICDKVAQRGILAGLDLGRVDQNMNHYLLITTTELNSKQQCDALVQALGGAL